MVDGNVVVVFCWDVSVRFLTPFSDVRSLLTNERYVAMHAMQEDSPHEHSHPVSNGYADSISSQRQKPKPQMRDTLAAVGGMLIPLLTQIGHHH